MPHYVRGGATAAVAGLVAPGGTLLVVQAVHQEGDDDGPPYPLTRAEIEAFGSHGLSPVTVEQVTAPDESDLWRAEYRR